MRRTALRVFLDANILFSASYRADSRFLDFWNLSAVTLVTSLYSIVEVTRNIVSPDQTARMNALIRKMEISSAGDLGLIPPGIVLAEKDRPILASAIFACVNFLVTGDQKHFGHLYGTSIEGVTILSPADFLTQFADRLID